jgi:hypothetical protein
MFLFREKSDPLAPRFEHRSRHATDERRHIMTAWTGCGLEDRSLCEFGGQHSSARTMTVLDFWCHA